LESGLAGIVADKSAPTGILPILIVKNHYRPVEGVDNLQQPIMIFKNRSRQCHPERSVGGCKAIIALIALAA
jgi:hypothetical protein